MTDRVEEDLFTDAIEVWGIDAQVDQTEEELAELLVALKSGDPDAVREELADVSIMVDQLSLFFGESAVARWREEKLARLEDRLEAADSDLVTDGSGHECDACGDTFETLTRLRLHEKDDCPHRETFTELDPGSDDVGNRAAGELATCRECGRENANADFEHTTSYDGSDFHYIAEFTCQACGFENENRVVMTGVDETDLANLPPHLQPNDEDLVTDGGRDTKYEIPDDHEWADEKQPEHTDADPLRVERSLHINDERDSIDRYNGLQWWFVFDDDGRINGIDLSHYCPGPGHTDPMGFVAWTDVPTIIQKRVLNVLNAASVEDAVDVEATAEVAEVTPP